MDRGVEIANQLGLYICHLGLFFLWANPQLSANSTIPNLSHDQQWPNRQIELSKAWSQLNKRHPLTIAIIDTGIDLQHPDLKESLWVNPGESGKDNLGRDKSNNGIDDDKNGYVDDIHGWNFAEDSNNVTDGHGHGTHVAGIITSSRSRGRGVTGIAPWIKIMVLKYYDPHAKGKNNLINTVRAIRYANEMQADIINYSGGGIKPSPRELKAITKSRELGILFVAAAGNNSSNTDLHPYYPASYGLDNILSVSSIDHRRKLLKSSNYGVASVDLAAPGKNILSTLPNGRHAPMTGTSQATAFATGVAALVMSRFPASRRPKEVIRQLVRTGTYEPQLHNHTRLQTRLNAHRAVTIRSRQLNAFDGPYRETKKVQAWATEIQDLLANQTPRSNLQRLLRFSQKLKLHMKKRPKKKMP